MAEQASSILEDVASLKTYQPIMMLNQLQGKVPLFLIHPGRGGAESYKNLSSLFEDNNKLISAVYGIESYNMAHLDLPITDMRLLAKNTLNI